MLKKTSDFSCNYFDKYTKLKGTHNIAKLQDEIEQIADILFAIYKVKKLLYQALALALINYFYHYLILLLLF